MLPPYERRGFDMAEETNRYRPNAARACGKPGRELRPSSITIDMHSHVAIPEAAAFVQPRHRS